MPSRHTSREHALQMIFQWEACKDDPDKVAAAFWGGLAVEPGERPLEEDVFANSLLFGVARHRDSLDETITRHAANWKIERMSAVDRNILRMSVYEMRHEKEPAAIVITEAIELGRRFSGEQSARFLNGVLDAVGKAQVGSSEPASTEPAPSSDPPQS